MTYTCDICNSKGDGYYAMNSTYGYCDNPECKKTADHKLGEEILEAIGNGDTYQAEELIGDGDIFEYI